MYFKIKYFILTCLVICAIYMARDISKPLWENNQYMGYENTLIEQTISVGAFAGDKINNEPELRIDKLSNFRSVINVVSEGAVPLIMYMLSILCLVDIIKNTYAKFNIEQDVVGKTLYILLIIGQISLMGLISYYVISISYEVLIIWLLFTLIVTGIVYLGPFMIENRK